MENGVSTKCKYLQLIGKKNFCRVYANRLSKIISVNDKGQKVYCMNRIDVKAHYENCPYNEEIKL